MDADIFFQLSPFAQCVLTHELNLVKWNVAFEQLVGRSIETKESFLRFISPSEQEKLQVIFTSLIKGEAREANFSLINRLDKQLFTTWKLYLGNDNVIYTFQIQHHTLSPAVSPPKNAKSLSHIPE